jgi:hypothetical protein
LGSVSGARGDGNRRRGVCFERVLLAGGHAAGGYDIFVWMVGST